MPTLHEFLEASPSLPGDLDRSKARPSPAFTTDRRAQIPGIIAQQEVMLAPLVELSEATTEALAIARQERVSQASEVFGRVLATANEVLPRL